MISIFVGLLTTLNALSHKTLSEVVLLGKSLSKFYFAINENQKKLYKAWKITNLLKLNINLSKINKQTNTLVKRWTIKAEVEVLLQTDMNSINKSWDSTEWAETLYSQKRKEKKMITDKSHTHIQWHKHT